MNIFHKIMKWQHIQIGTYRIRKSFFYLHHDNKAFIIEFHTGLNKYEDFHRIQGISGIRWNPSIEYVVVAVSRLITTCYPSLGHYMLISTPLPYLSLISSLSHLQIDPPRDGLCLQRMYIEALSVPTFCPSIFGQYHFSKYQFCSRVCFLHRTYSRTHSRPAFTPRA